MDIFSAILYPFKWVIELLLVAFHTVFSFLGMNPDDGLTWVLAITGLVHRIKNHLHRLRRLQNLFG